MTINFITSSFQRTENRSCVSSIPTIHGSRRLESSRIMNSFFTGPRVGARGDDLQGRRKWRSRLAGECSVQHRHGLHPCRSEMQEHFSVILSKRSQILSRSMFFARTSEPFDWLQETALTYMDVGNGGVVLNIHRPAFLTYMDV